MRGRHRGHALAPSPAPGAGPGAPMADCLPPPRPPPRSPAAGAGDGTHSLGPPSLGQGPGSPDRGQSGPFTQPVKWKVQGGAAGFWPGEQRCPLPLLDPADCTLTPFYQPAYKGLPATCSRRDGRISLVSVPGSLGSEAAGQGCVQNAEGELVINGSSLECRYRALDEKAFLLPDVKKIRWVGEWTPVPKSPFRVGFHSRASLCELKDDMIQVPAVQFVIQCQEGQKTVIDDSFFSIPPERAAEFKVCMPGSEDEDVDAVDELLQAAGRGTGALSIDMFFLESVSLNQARRTMPRTWQKLQDMGFHHFLGYNKASSLSQSLCQPKDHPAQVGDNTLVNTHPIMTGKLFRGLRESDAVPTGPALTIEDEPFLWKRMPGMIPSPCPSPSPHSRMSLEGRRACGSRTRTRAWTSTSTRRGWRRGCGARWPTSTCAPG